MSVPPLNLQRGEDVGTAVRNWLDRMRQGFQEWFNYQMEENLPAKQKPYQYG